MEQKNKPLTPCQPPLEPGSAPFGVPAGYGMQEPTSAGHSPASRYRNDGNSGLPKLETTHPTNPPKAMIDPHKKLVHDELSNLITHTTMSFDLVFFGGTGDLTWRKLMPALFQAFRHGKLPAGGRILAVARDDRTDEAYREFIRERFAEVEPSKRPSDAEFNEFAALLH
jgi:hypothetical protein